MLKSILKTCKKKKKETEKNKNKNLQKTMY